MANVASTSMVRQLGSLFEGGSASGLSDRQLLERFAPHGQPPDEAAFATIVSRHGPMVLGVCRQLLGDHQHAEDAFQATFLVLARQARSIRDPDALGPWLYGVALRVARKARARLARHRQTEERGAVIRPEARADHPAEQAIGREHAEALHREIERLPRTFRVPVVLCYFEGLSPDEAAARLRCPGGTLRSRLARARERLRRGLLRRGVVLSTTALAAALSPRSARASIPPLLCDSTTRAAIAFAARHAAGGALSASSADLAQEVLKTMMIHKLRTAAISVCLAAAVAAGAGVLSARSTTTKEGPVQAPAASKADRPDPRPRPGFDPATLGRMMVTGRVLRPDNQPAAGVPVEIIAAPRTPLAETDAGREAFVVLGRGESDADGRFRIEAARSSSSRFSDVHALAGAATDTGFGSAALNPDVDQPSTEIHLPPEQVIRGKLMDINGQPAAGVAVQLDNAHRGAPDAQFDPPKLGHSPSLIGSPEGLRTWPKPAVTDAQGRFALGGIGRGLSLWLAVNDPRFAQERIVVQAAERAAGKELALALQPSTIIEGRVLAADTGRPVPDALVSVRASSGALGPMFTTRFRADGQGRFRLNPSAGDYFRMRAVPPEGQSYLPGDAELEWTKGAVRKEVDIAVPRGVPIVGRVTEEGTGRPVAGANVRFCTPRRPGGLIEGDATAGEDGSFRLAVPPGRGHLMVLAPSLDYVPEEIPAGMLFGRGRRGSERFYAHDIVAYEVKAGEDSHEIDASLRRGATIRGRVVGPAGQTVPDAVVLTRQQFDPINRNWLGHDPIRARDGRFELSGFDPEKPMPAYFLDAEHEWGAAMAFSGEQAGEERTVRLQPCGRALARFVGPTGQPVAGLRIIPYVALVMTPGSVRHFFIDGGDSLAADTAFLNNIDSRHYPNALATDADGRITLPALIPGAPYRVVDWSTRNTQEKGIRLRKDFTVKPGETLDLGDILVEQPEGRL